MDKDTFWAELAALGEDQVREKIGLGLYREKREKWANEWLRQQEQERANNMRAPWYKTWWGKSAIAILIIVLSTALISRLGL